MSKQDELKAEKALAKADALWERAEAAGRVAGDLKAAWAKAENVAIRLRAIADAQPPKEEER